MAQIGILVVAHGDLSSGLISAAEEILGEQPGLKALKLDPAASEPKQHIAAAVDELDEGYGVLVLTDLFGGTPSNVTLAASVDQPVEVVTGANLPLLIRALSKRATLELGQLADTVAEYGRQQIMTPNRLLEKAVS